MSDLDQILAGETPVEEAQPQTELQPETSAEPDQEASTEEPETKIEEPAKEAEPVKPEDHSVPTSVVTALRQEIRDLKSQLAPKQEASPPPDFFEDPQGAVKHQLAPVEQQMQSIKLDMSEAMAEQQHGREVLDKAWAALQASGDSMAYQQIMSTKSPWHSLVDWHNRQQIAQEIGNDPAAYRAKIEAEVREKLQAELVAKQAKDAAAKAAPSMANVTGMGSANAGNWTPASLDEIL